MEAVGAAASIAGLLGLVGQSIDGLVKVRKFLNDATQARKKVKRLLSEIGVLNLTLSQVQLILMQIRETRREFLDDLTATLDELAIHMTMCEMDAREWARVASGLDPSHWAGLKAFFRKVKIASSQDLFDEFHDKIAHHQRRISLSLSILGRQVHPVSFRSHEFAPRNVVVNVP